jgi:uncharacterized protein YeaO (DUF488 family)
VFTVQDGGFGSGIPLRLQTRPRDDMMHLAMTISARRSFQATEVELKVRHELKIKRVYEKPDKNDGGRILVDRLWPRGLTKEKAKVDLWLKDIAPSTELRKWFEHDLKKWRSFRGRYQTELKHHCDQLKLLKTKTEEGPVTLVYGARDQAHNEAVVLKQFLERTS